MSADNPESSISVATVLRKLCDDTSGNPRASRTSRHCLPKLSGSRRVPVEDGRSRVDRPPTHQRRTRPTRPTHRVGHRRTNRRTDDEAAEVAEELNRDIGLYMRGDNIDVTVTTGNGHTILHCTRERLAFHAHANEQIISSGELRRYVHYYRSEEQTARPTTTFLQSETGERTPNTGQRQTSVTTSG
jgi:hypothetical protein